MTSRCLLGMLPVLFIAYTRTNRLKEQAQLERLYQDSLNQAKLLVEAKSTCLYLRVNKAVAVEDSNFNFESTAKEERPWHSHQLPLIDELTIVVHPVLCQAPPVGGPAWILNLF